MSVQRTLLQEPPPTPQMAVSTYPARPCGPYLVQSHAVSAAHFLDTRLAPALDSQLQSQHPVLAPRLRHSGCRAPMSTRRSASPSATAAAAAAGSLGRPAWAASMELTAMPRPSASARSVDSDSSRPRSRAAASVSAIVTSCWASAARRAPCHARDGGRHLEHKTAA